MMSRKKVIAATLLTMFLAACSQEADKPAATASTDAPKATAEAPKADNADRLDTRFVTIATGGASGP